MYDLNVWKQLPHGGYVKREYIFEGWGCGNFVRMPVTLTQQHPSIPNVYAVSAKFASDCYFAPDWARLDQLTEINRLFS